DEDFAFLVADREFGFAVEFDRARDSALLGVDCGGIVAAAIESKHALAGAIIKNGVGILSGFDLVQRLQCVQIENANGPFTAITDESPAKFLGEGDAMHAGCIWDVSDGLAGIGVDNHDVCGARDEEMAL